MEYRIVTVIDDKMEFCGQVMSLISDGWELYGGPMCTSWVLINDDGLHQAYTEYGQAVIKREKMPTSD